MRRVANSLKTTGLFAFLWVVLLALGWGIAYGTNQPAWIWIFAGIGLISTAYTYWNSKKIALASMRAVPVTREQAPGLYRIVEELSSQLEMPMPEVYIAPTSTPNAFATGRNPKHAAVCCTEGILQLLNERQLKGVLGHELMHVYNRDILTASVASAIGGLISSLAQFALYFGGSSRGRGGGNNNVGAIAGMLAALVAPFAAGMIQMGISRTREYEADADGSLLTGDPQALAEALMLISNGTKAAPMPPTPKNESVAALMIANPFKGRKGLSNMFSTHPPMEDRIERLRAQGQELGRPF